MNIATILCNRNYGKYLKGSIASSINQTHPNIRAIFDDSSTDNSREILIEHFNDVSPYKVDGNYHYYKYNGDVCILNTGQPVGPSAARNALIREVWDQVDAVQILDADDEMYENKIEELSDRLSAGSGGIGGVYADYDILNVESGTLTREYKYPYSQQELFKHCIVHSGSLISKQALYAVVRDGQFYNESMRTCEDYELYVRISRKFLFSHVAKPLTLVRVHKANSTFSVDKTIWNQNWQRVREEIINGS